MSGGTFDYIQYRIDEAVEDIERRIQRNGKTVLQLWNEKSEDEKECAAEYERPWDLLHHPYWVDDEAQDKADAALGIFHKKTLDPYGQYMKLPPKDKEEWQRIKRETMRKIIDDHNNSCDGMVFSDETISRINEMIPTIKKAKIFLDRIDWLFAGDDGEESFKERLEDDLKEAGLEP